MFELDYAKDYILQDKNVILSPLKKEHVQHLLEISNDKSIWTYFLENGYGQHGLNNYVNKAIQNRKKKIEYPFVIFDKVKNSYAGTTRLYEYNADIRTIKLGHTWIGKSFQGTGLNKHCKYLLFEFAFENLINKRIV